VTVRLAFKILGSGFLLASGALAGRHLAKALARRLSVLEEFQVAMERLVTEIRFSSSPLHEALEELATACRDECRDFFLAVVRLLRQGDGLPAKAAWSDALEAWAKSSALASTDIESIALLGPALGSSGREDQSKHLESLIQRLRVHVDEARARSSKLGAFYREMGLYVASLMILLLL